MTGTDERLREELDLAYPAPADEPDWDQVLRRLAPTTDLKPRRGRRLAAVAVGSLAFAAAAAIVLIAPWRGSSSFSAKALAAIGHERYVQAVVEPSVAQSALVNLRTGSERRVTEKTRYSYDTESGEYLTWNYVDGVLVGSDDVLPGTGMPEPGLAAFLGGYRSALANGSATVVGKTTFDGHKAKIVSFDASTSTSSSSGFHTPYGIHIPGETEEVAIDNSTYQPLWYRFTSSLPNGKREQWPIYRIDSITSSSRPGPAPTSTPDRIGQVRSLRTVTPTGATHALGHIALWPGATVGGQTLRSLRLQRVTTAISPYITPAIRSGLGLDLVYGASNGRLEIQEAPSPQGAYFFDTSRLGRQGPIAAPGSIRLGCNDYCFATNQPAEYRGIWTGQLRQGGLYITIQSESRSLVIEAARSLVRMR